MTCYGLDDRGSIPGRSRDISQRYRVHPAPGAKRPDHEPDHSPPSSAKVNAWSYTSTSPIRLHVVVLS